MQPQYPTNYTANDLVTADGLHRNYIAVNNSMPGPTLAVYRGRRVIVHIKNNLLLDIPISLHFHGLDQNGTFFMDGVAYVTQCPIMPKETFTYNFIASDNPGTYWYHDHLGQGRGNGLFGAFVIVDENDDNVPEGEANDFLMVLNDWYRKPPELRQWQIENGLVKSFPAHESTGIAINFIPMANKHIGGSVCPSVKNRSQYTRHARACNYLQMQCMQHTLSCEFTFQNKFSYGYESNKCFNLPKDATRVRISAEPWHTALVNGKSWPNVSQHLPVVGDLPLERFLVSSGNNSNGRLRLVNAGVEKFFLVSIDGHKLEVTASDARPICPTIVDALFIGPGERYDFHPIRSNRSQSHYLIRVHNAAELDKDFHRSTFIQDEYTLAVLSYNAELLPQKIRDIPQKCSSESRCTYLNCPFGSYPNGYHRRCLQMNDLNGTLPVPSDMSTATNVQRFFLNYAFQNTTTVINGIHFQMPHYPPFLFLENPSHAVTQCPKDCGKNETCRCTQIINITIGKWVELVIYANPGHGNVTQYGVPHTFHLHGHHFFVLKQGFPAVNSQGIAVTRNMDWKCRHFGCNYAEWKNSSWYKEGGIVGGNYLSPISKDTVFVPYGGYTVVRFKADNVGWWFMHCHVLTHSVAGMGRNGSDLQRRNGFRNAPTIWSLSCLWAEI